MEKLRLLHLSSPRGSSSSFILALSSLLFRIRHAFRFRIAFGDVHPTTLQVLQTINCSIQRISLPREYGDAYTKGWTRESCSESDSTLTAQRTLSDSFAYVLCTDRLSNGSRFTSRLFNRTRFQSRFFKVPGNSNCGLSSSAILKGGD